MLKSIKPVYIYIVSLIIAIAGFANFGMKSWHQVMGYNLPDNDDAMRVLEVRDWFHGQAFYDLINHRLNPPNGGDIHWSRLSDLPLAFWEIILKPFVPASKLEIMATAITPLFLGVIFAILVGLAAKRLAKGNYIAVVLAAIFAFNTSGILGYFNTGRVDHHGLQLIFLVLGLYGLVRLDKLGAILSAFAIAGSLTVGLEATPVLAIYIAWVALVWGFRGDKARDVTIYFSLYLAIFSIIGFLIDVPPERFLDGQNDRFSIAQLAPLVIGGVLLFVSALTIKRQTILIRFIALVLIAFFVIITAMQYPVLLKKLYWQTSPLLQKIWIGVISETKPLYKEDVPTLVILGLFELCASAAVLLQIINVAVLRFWKNKENRDLDVWLLAGGLVIILTLMAFFWQLRVAGQAQTFAIIVATAIAADLFRTQKSMIPGLIVLLLVNPMNSMIANNIYFKYFFPHSNKAAAPSKYDIGGGSACRGAAPMAELIKQPSGLIVAPIDLGAQILLVTDHKVLAAPYHRNQGNDTAYRIFMQSSNDAHKKLKEINASYIAICTRSSENQTLINQNDKGLMADLVNNNAPKYLQQLPRAKGSNIILWKIVK